MRRLHRLNLKDELYEENGLPFYQNKIIVPLNLRGEILKNTGHVGTRRANDLARQSIYWPNLAQDIIEKYFRCYWRSAAKREKLADFVIIATVDREHKESTIAFAQLGYHILLEKPMAVTEADCREVVRVCNRWNVKLSVCHVLRYTHWVRKIKEVIDSGELGDIVSIRHTEPIGYWRFSHAFVRGNWSNEAASTFSLMSKSCHDIDLINHWMSPHRCRRVSSFGKLSHFTKENKPPGAASRCLDCPYKNSCLYSSKRFYLDLGHTGYPLGTLTCEVDIENVTDALRTGPYGRCVYDADNDVMSHQVSALTTEYLALLGVDALASLLLLVYAAEAFYIYIDV
ncbi:uncharacterized protein LOC106012685 [Aplysia californica]|uniref:Uncharacterized protein LOC106012685 n=1 Tax=Aplysia californica TaxID=6500 RepID=A0ABM1VYG0_APLCA|nr:uncharacterized protein LOC106012685 [Aplysia californica]